MSRCNSALLLLIQKRHSFESRRNAFFCLIYRELLARIKANLRRLPEENFEEKQVRIGKLDAVFSTYDIREDGEPVKMTHREIEVMKYFWLHQNETISRDDLLSEIWGYDYAATTRTVDNFILRLRNAIEPDPHHPKHLITVHGLGYKYIP